MSSERARFDELGIQIGRMLNGWAVFAGRPRQYGTGRRVYPSEMAAVEVIAHAPRINVTALAATLGVTKGAASQTVGKLVRKRLVRKTGGGQNAREVCLELTAPGRTAAENGAKFYELAHRLFRRRYGTETPSRMRQLHEAFAEFAAFFEEFVRHCPPDFPVPKRRPPDRDAAESRATRQGR